MDTKGYRIGNKVEISGNEIMAYQSIELTVEAMKLGAADYLIKPVDLITRRGLSEGLSLKGKIDIKKAMAYFYSEAL